MRCETLLKQISTDKNKCYYAYVDNVFKIVCVEFYTHNEGKW